jgi:hypothetical protein
MIALYLSVECEVDILEGTLIFYEYASSFGMTLQAKPNLQGGGSEWWAERGKRGFR